MNKIISHAEAKALGLKKYFTGKPCRKGHIAERWTGNRTCAQCTTDTKLEWNERNAEYRAAYSKAYNSIPEVKAATNQRQRELRRKKRAANPEEVRAKDRAHRNANLERYRERQKNWRIKNLERLVKEERERYWANRGAMLERRRMWARSNPEANRARVHRRRARILKSKEHHTAQDILDLLVSQRHKCANCRDPIKKGYHVDHIVPLAKGGSNGKTNIQLLCPTCNMKKGSKDPIDWAHSNGRLL